MQKNLHDSRLVFISAAEPSADRLGEALIRKTLELRPNVRFVGVAGPRMREAGCWSIFDMTRHAAMLLNALGAAGRAMEMMRTATAYLRKYEFDAAVVIDSPALHLGLAGKAHRLGIPVMYYIAPQLWAWGAWRAPRLRRRVDEIAAILPFEPEYFKKKNIDVKFVGHPLVDTLARTPIDEDAVSLIRGNAELVVGLLPGSRKHVVGEVLAGQLEVAQRIAKTMPSVRFAVSVANSQVEAQIRDAASKADVPIHVHDGRHIDLIEASDLVLVASGTITLEVAYLRTPMIVMYNASPLAYNLLARWLLKTKYLSLPNILANREIVPEFMPYYRSTDPIFEQALRLLKSKDDRQEMANELWQAVAPLNTGDAEERVAQMLLGLADGTSKH